MPPQQDMAAPPFRLLGLPTDIVFSVLDFLGPLSKVRLRQTCSFFRNRIEQDVGDVLLSRPAGHDYRVPMRSKLHGYRTFWARLDRLVFDLTVGRTFGWQSEWCFPIIDDQFGYCVVCDGVVKVGRLTLPFTADPSNWRAAQQCMECGKLIVIDDGD